MQFQLLSIVLKCPDLAEWKETLLGGILEATQQIKVSICKNGGKAFVSGLLVHYFSTFCLWIAFMIMPATIIQDVYRCFTVTFVKKQCTGTENSIGLSHKV